MTATCERSNHKKRAGEDMRLSTRDDADKAVRRAITALAGLGDLERLHPLDQIAVGQAAAEFADTVTAAVRRSNGTGRRGKRGTRRGRGTAPAGDAA